MALGGRKKTVEIEFIADTDKATRGIKNVGDTAQKQESKFSQLGTKAKLGFAAAAVGVGIAIDFLKDAATAALEDQKAQDLLALALRNSAKATDAQIKATETFIEKTALASGVADDELRPALAELARATGDVEEAQDLLGVAMDISAAKGIPLEAVTRAIGKAANGNVGALGRMGIKVKDTDGKLISFEEAMAEANRTMGDASETAAETGAGAMARLTVAFDEAKEKLGAQLIPILLELADVAQDAFAAFENAEFNAGIEDQDLSVMESFAEDLHDITHWYEDPAIKGIADFFGITIPTGADTSKTAIDRLGKGALAAMQETVPVFEQVEDSVDEVTDATKRSTDAFYINRDAVRAMHDPVFALAEAQRGLDEATIGAAEAAKEHGDKSPEYLDALGKVRDAAVDVQDAERTLGSTTGSTRATMETHLRSLAVYTEGQIQFMLDQFDLINAFEFKPKTIFVNMKGNAIDTGHPGFSGGVTEHVGGVVPGAYPGQEVPVLARAGEPFGSAAGNGHSAAPVAVTVNVDGRKFFEEVVMPQMARYSRRNGSLGI